VGFDNNKALYVDVNATTFAGNYVYSTKKLIYNYLNKTRTLIDMFNNIRTDFGCSANPAYPCGLTTLISIIITIGCIAFIFVKIGNFGSFGISILSLFILGFLTYVGLFYWVLYIILIILIVAANFKQSGGGTVYG
jgi:hypothetical protein